MNIRDTLIKMHKYLARQNKIYKFKSCKNYPSISIFYIHNTIYGHKCSFSFIIRYFYPKDYRD